MRHKGVFLTVPRKFIEHVYFSEEYYFESAVPFHSCMAGPDESDKSERGDTGRKTYHTTLTSVSVLREFISEGGHGFKINQSYSTKLIGSNSSSFLVICA